MGVIDFTDCPRVKTKAYNGANGSKIAVIYNGEIYMLKFPPAPTKKGVELSYTNSCISEYICCHVFESAGIRVQETLLGVFSVNGKEKVVCACKDFTGGNKTFFDFCSIKNTIIDSELSGKGTDIAEITEAIELQEMVDPGELMRFCFDMFIVDALIGNFDRHNGNFGFLFDEGTHEFEIAPVYDCGSCLLPQADDELMEKLLHNRGEFNSRVYNFPLSAIRENGMKINYHDFITSLKNGHCNDALRRVVPRINMASIISVIDGTDFITDIRKDFYKAYIKARYELILLPAFEKLENRIKGAVNRDTQDKPQKISVSKQIEQARAEADIVNAGRDNSGKRNRTEHQK